MKNAVLPLLVLALAVTLTAQQRGQRDPRTAGGGNCSNNPYNCIDTPNPLKTPDTIWLEEMTWMDVRDALKAGKTTIIIPTGGMEPNGPWLALGKRKPNSRACIAPYMQPERPRRTITAASAPASSRSSPSEPP